MALHVIGAGFGRTGTNSLKLGLEQLGFGPCYHMFELVDNPQHLPHWQRAANGETVDWPALFDGYRAAVDWPTCTYWAELTALYPEAKVVLGVRDPESWHRSVLATIYPSSTEGLDSPDASRRGRATLIKQQIWDGTFGGRIEDAEHAMGVFQAHNDKVIASVPEDKLLVFHPREGWEPLCRFLGVPVPDTPFPRVNSTADFKRDRSNPTEATRTTDHEGEGRKSST